MYAELKQRICSVCKETKTLDKFGKDHLRSRGYSYTCKPCKKSWRADFGKREPKRVKAKNFQYDLKKLYGLSVGEYDKMYADQSGCCACCGVHATNFKRRLHVDHDKITGKIRALLCTQCNPGIGFLQHSVDRLKLAIIYLEKFKN